MNILLLPHHLWGLCPLAELFNKVLANLMCLVLPVLHVRHAEVLVNGPVHTTLLLVVTNGLTLAGHQPANLQKPMGVPNVNALLEPLIGVRGWVIVCIIAKVMILKDAAAAVKLRILPHEAFVI